MKVHEFIKNFFLPMHTVPINKLRLRYLHKQISEDPYFQAKSETKKKGFTYRMEVRQLDGISEERADFKGFDLMQAQPLFIR